MGSRVSVETCLTRGAGPVGWSQFTRETVYVKYRSKSANRNVWISSGRLLTRPLSARPPISLDTIVARSEGYTYDASVWDLSIVQGPFSVAACQP
jgi:hypothetical protein